MSIARTQFGKTNDQKAVDLFTVTNRRGSIVKITTYGARVTELHVPDKHGTFGNVVMGYDNLAQYLLPQPYFGTTVGRVANRIARGTFVIDGVTYHTPINNGPNTLHGGAIGIDRHVWTGEPADAGDDNSIAFSLVSPDGDQGFPGRLSMRVVYRFSDENELKIEFEATTDKPTPVNLCNHSYFNLAGPGSGTILNHVLTLNASRIPP